MLGHLWKLLRTPASRTEVIHVVCLACGNWDNFIRVGQPAPQHFVCPDCGHQWRAADLHEEDGHLSGDGGMGFGSGDGGC